MLWEEVAAEFCFDAFLLLSQKLILVLEKSPKVVVVAGRRLKLKRGFTCLLSIFLMENRIFWCVNKQWKALDYKNP
jgi:hypothetical protein